MGPVQTAIRRHLGRGDVLHTPSRRAEFVIGSIDSGGLVLLLGEGRHATPLSWEGLEGVIPFMASHGGSVRIGSLFDTRAIPGTLDEHLVGKEALRSAYERPVLPRTGGKGGLSRDLRPEALEIRHMIHPPVIRVSDSGDHAIVAAVYGMVVTSGDGPTTRRGEHEGGYIFELRRVPEVGWRFCKMSVISENARNPMFWAS